MQPTSSLPRVYLITDRTVLPGQPADPCAALLRAVEAALAGGVRLVQLREKDLSGRVLTALARAMRDLTHKHGARLLINDRVDVALAVEADGVHLPVGGFPPRKARDILGERALIGVSTHSEAEARSAVEQGADFIVFGPVYETPSKRVYGQPVGREALAHVCRTVSVPVFGLGGIGQTQVREVREAGAHGVALRSAILAASDVTVAARAIVDVAG